MIRGVVIKRADFSWLVAEEKGLQFRHKKSLLGVAFCIYFKKMSCNLL